MKFFGLVILTAFCFSLTENVNSQEEPFPGQRSLSILLKRTEGFSGKIFLHDFPDSSTHEERMLSTLNRSVPRKNIIAFKGVQEARKVAGIPVKKQGWTSGYYAKKMKENGVRVIHVPTRWHHTATPTERAGKIQALKSQDLLAVYAAGNFGTLPHLDIYHPDDPYWGSKPPKSARRRTYQEVAQLFQSGHAIMANYAIRKPATLDDFVKWSFNKRNKNELKKAYQNAGTYVRHPLSARFGDLKAHGFTVSTEKQSTRWNKKGFALTTSDASAHVAAFAFYLRQLWDTTAEVLTVMQETAIDIGEPGIDEEFGWGLINVHHLTIWSKAIKRLEESLEFCLLEDVALEKAVTTAKKEGLDLFHSIESGKREIGLIFSKNKTKFAVATGTTASPFGLSSRFLQQQQTTVAQLGIQHSFTDNISVIGIYGRSRHEDFGVHKGSLGVGYQKHFSDDKGNISLYVGHRSIWGTFGIPGYKVLDIAQTPFALQMVEMRASFAWVF